MEHIFKIIIYFLIHQNVPQIMSFHLRYMMVSLVKKFLSYEGRKLGHLAQIQPKSQFLFHKNLPPQDFSIMTLPIPVWLLGDSRFFRLQGIKVL